MIKMIMDLMNKVDSMQEQIGNVSRKMKILKKTKKQKKCSRLKYIVTERMPLMSSLVQQTQLRKDSEFEDVSVETSKTEKQNKDWQGRGEGRGKDRISKDSRTCVKKIYNMCNGNTIRKGKKEREYLKQ